MKVIRNTALLLLALVPYQALSAELACAGPGGKVEEYHYTWRLRGGLGWIAGFVFPRSGSGELKTVYNSDGDLVQSELMITSAQAKGGYYRYESLMEPDASRTLTTFHGYQWGKRARREKTTFDYVKGLARIHKETPEKTEDNVRMLPASDIRDVLTAIHYLRSNADAIKSPITTAIYSDGKEYPVVFKPAKAQVFTIGSQRVNALGFEIVDAPGGKRWPGGVRVWLSDDGRRIPFKIEIVETGASLSLELQTVKACGFMNAQR